MTRFAIIDAGRVTNIIESDAAFAASIGAIDATGASMGDLWDGQAFTRPPLPPIAARRAAAWEAIKAKRDTLSDEGGYKIGVNGIDKWFHSDGKSKTQQLSLVVMGAAVSNVPPWKTMDGSKVTLTQAMVGQIFNAAVTQDGTLFAVAENHKTAMEASADPSTYDFSGGWPAVFVPAAGA